MRVVREIPLPSEEELRGWIPSRQFPSDHMSVSPLCPRFDSGGHTIGLSELLIEQADIRFARTFNNAV